MNGKGSSIQGRLNAMDAKLDRLNDSLVKIDVKFAGFVSGTTERCIAEAARIKALENKQDARDNRTLGALGAAILALLGMLWSILKGNL